MVVQVLWPFTIQLSPSCSAVVVKDARSEPASGSLNSWHPHLFAGIDRTQHRLLFRCSVSDEGRSDRPDPDKSCAVRWTRHRRRASVQRRPPADPLAHPTRRDREGSGPRRVRSRTAHPRTPSGRWAAGGVCAASNSSSSAETSSNAGVPAGAWVSACADACAVVIATPQRSLAESYEPGRLARLTGA